MTIATAAPVVRKKKPVVKTFAAKDLRVDPAVQRGVEEGTVKKLVDHWDDLSVGVLIGSLRADGQVYLIDGQQRRESKLRTNPDYKFQVLVHEGLTLVEEAKIFIHANKDRKVVGAYYLHVVRRAAKDPVTLAIDTVCDSLSLKVDVRSKGRSISCVTVMNRIVENGTKYTHGDVLTADQKARIASNSEDLQWALNFYDETWGTADPAWRGEMVEALAAFHRKFGGYAEFNPASLSKKLRGRKVAGISTGVVDLLGVARMRSIGSNRVVGPLTTVLQEIHDHGKVKNRLVPMTDDDD